MLSAQPQPEVKIKEVFVWQSLIISRNEAKKNPFENFQWEFSHLFKTQIWQRFRCLNDRCDGEEKNLEVNET